MGRDFLLFTLAVAVVCLCSSLRVVPSRVGFQALSRLEPLRMSVYSVDKGIPAQLVEERDACGVGFIASLTNEASHSVVKQALDACSCMEHRGATSSDNVSGDGSGVMTTIPWELFSSLADPSERKNNDGSVGTAISMTFMPNDAAKHKEAMEMVSEVSGRNGFEVVGWRDVPVDPSVLGRLARDFVPRIQQFAVRKKAGSEAESSVAFERQLYDLRREIQGFFRKLEITEGYICSMSSKTIVYKGMLRSCDLPAFYKDLTDPKYKAVFAIYHRRFSTNTIPKWFLAQPFRMVAHNGEINTLLGNINWVKSKQYSLRKEPNILDDSLVVSKSYEHKRVRAPLVDLGRSDSANLDSILNLLVQGGRTPTEAVMILVPEAYSSQPSMVHTPEVADFYQYFESIQEAWDGPALLTFSDGDLVCAALDRNGLRPARFMVTQEGDDPKKKTVHVMSEVGVTKALSQFADAQKSGVNGGMKIIDSGRLGPGEMIAVDLKQGKLMLNDEVKMSNAKKSPYGEWNKRSIVHLKDEPFDQDAASFVHKYITDDAEKTSALEVVSNKVSTMPVATVLDAPDLITTQTVFGWGTEDVEVQIDAMAKDAIEATFCMGDDAPLAALSSFSHTLYDYFKQRFAQVTNPPIDPLREGAVMSLVMYLGPKGDVQSSDMQPGVRVKIDSPVLNAAELKTISETKGVKVVSLSTLYPMTQALSVGGLMRAMDMLCDAAVDAVLKGATIVNLSDMPDTTGYKDTAYVPPLLAVGAVHHRLIEAGLRTKASIIVSTGQAWSTHHFACLVGFGASAVLPYAAYDAVVNWHGQKRNQLAMERGDIPKLSAAKAIANYRKAVDKGILKVLSKMGISLLTSYHGAQIFESIGLADEVLLTAFKGTPSRVSGLSFDEIAAENADFSRRAFGDSAFEGMADRVQGEAGAGEGKAKKLFNYGFLNFFKSGEYHHNNQPLIKQLHGAIRSHDLDLYNLYEQSVRSRPPTTIRDCFEFNKFGPSVRSPIPLESVESAESIMRRFCSGGMSLGALSREAHETLAISMNRIGGKSNCGEGGEDPVRLSPINDVSAEGTSATFPHLKGLVNGDYAGSRIKQVASGRFGVTPQYLMSADQLEIKIAQGAKPGEGGQLPGPKIDAYIARLRKSKPGVTLISPPPHHDIYSIEDLAQLIYDLHQINPKAGVSVKLVSEVGIGTVASGVTKAGADVIQVSGHDGGTGASPASSIKHAGSPWELGLVEVHQTLMQNGLRDRVLLRVDGGLKTGWDVVMAAAMGAEEFGFGTIAMIAEGCIMARICHTNKCPVGITTQNEALRKKFPGTPDNIVTFFGYVAEEVRHILAELGYKSIDEVIGRPGLLRQRQDLKLKKSTNVDMSFVLDSLVCQFVDGENFCDPADDSSRQWLKKGPNFSNGHTFDDDVLADKDVLNAINNQKSTAKTYQIANTDRSAFARVSGVIAAKWGDGGFQGRLRFSLTGAAGQSFGAFARSLARLFVDV